MPGSQSRRSRPSGHGLSLSDHTNVSQTLDQIHLPTGMVPLTELELRPFWLQELVAAFDSEDMVVVLGASREK